MARNFLPFFQKNTEFNKNLQAMKKWSERIGVSPPISFEGATYYLVRTSGLLKGQALRRLGAFDGQGRRVEDEALLRDLYQVYSYFHYLNHFYKDIVSDQDESRQKQMLLLKDALAHIQEGLAEKLEDEDREVLADLMTYYNQAEERLEEVAEAAAACLDLWEELEGLGADETIGADLLEGLRLCLHTRENARGQLEALMLHNSLYLRKQVKAILSKESNKALIKNKHSLERVIKDLDYLEYLSQHFLDVGRSDWALDEDLLGIERGSFTREKYIEELRGGQLGDSFVRTMVESFIRDHQL